MAEQKIISVYEESNQSYVLLSRIVWEKNPSLKDFAKEETNALGFRYYAQNYQYQILKSNFELSDLFLGYKDTILNAKYLKLLTEKFPDYVKMESLSTTNSNSEILALRMTNRKVKDDQKLSILFNCSIHANEVVTTDHCYDIIYTILKDQKLIDTYLDKLVLWIIPIVNPDGSIAFWNTSHLQGRKNSSQNNLKGVDLNRNFPFHWGKTGGEFSSNKIDSPYFQGPSEASEIETQTLVSLAEKERFVASISFHAFANALLYPYSVEGFLNPSPDLAEIVGKKISKKAKSSHPVKPFLLKKNLYPIDGVDQDFYYYKYGTLAYVLESSHFNPSYEYVPKILESFRNIWTRLLDQIVSGDKILVRITGESGEPVQAKIQILGQNYFQGETRFSSPSTGLFYSYFVPELDGELLVESEGYLPIKQKIQKTTKWEIKTITLQKLR